MPTQKSMFQLVVGVALVYAVLYIAYTVASGGSNLPPVVATAITARLEETSHAWSSFTSNPATVAAAPIDSKGYYPDLAQSDARDAGIPPDLFVRQINLESGFNTNEVSPAGAIGIAQFMPATAAGLGIDPWDPVQSLQGAAQLMGRYTRNYGGDYAKALAAYNGGSGNLQAAISNCGAQWLACMPAETQHYVQVILNQ